MKNRTKYLVLACGMALGSAPAAFAQQALIPEPPAPKVTAEEYGRDGNPGQRLELGLGQDSTSHFLEIGGEVYPDQAVLLAIGAAKLDARFPWGDVLLIDPAQIAVILTVTPCLITEPLSECGKVRFRARDLAIAPGDVLTFYMQAFAADMSGIYPFLTSPGLAVTVDNRWAVSPLEMVPTDSEEAR